MRASQQSYSKPVRLCRIAKISNFPGQNRLVVAHAAGHAADATRREPSALSLEFVRTQLIRQEDSIIFSLIERAQFCRNENVYIPGGVPVPAYMPNGKWLTFLEYLLMDTEAVHGRIRRYTSPDEHAFFPDVLPAMVRFPVAACATAVTCADGAFDRSSAKQVLPPQDCPSVLARYARYINLNPRIMDLYLDTILPGITQPGDDTHYGSAATQDVLALQVWPTLSPHPSTHTFQTGHSLLVTNHTSAVQQFHVTCRSASREPPALLSAARSGCLCMHYKNCMA